MSTENRIREGLNKLGQAVELIAATELSLPEPQVNSVSGNAIHGGKITLFRSTGITDNASRLVLLVGDDGITVDAVDTDRLVGDVTVEGTLTADTIRTRELIADKKTTENIEFHAGRGSTIDMRGLEWKSDDKTKLFAYRERSNGFYSSENIDLHKDASIMIDNIPALSANGLGEMIQHSNLTSVGVLNNLVTTGDLNVDEGFVTWDSGTMRFSIGNELPNAQFSVSSNEAEFVVDPDFDTIRLGAWTTHHLEIITDGTPRITIKDTGAVNVRGKLGVNQDYVAEDVDLQVKGPVRIQGKKIEYNTAMPESGNYAKGDIVYNTEPTPGGFVGWICVQSGTPGTWKAFGRIED
jgi:hypothetical protein